jgi:glycosyltransferase involved in cell wall biosynthesis
MKNPAFSIVTPSFNSLDNLKRAVGSVRSQAGVSLEHVIQDGGSTDGTVEFLEKFDTEVRDQESEIRSQRSEIKGQQEEPKTQSLMPYTFSYSSEPDNGMYDAINIGWERARGDILSWLNSDEQYLPGTLEKVQKVFSENPAVDVVWGQYICVDPSGNPVSVRKDIPACYFFMRNVRTSYIGSSTVFFRRKLLDSNLLKLDLDYKYSADKELYLRLLKGGVQFKKINDYLTLFGISDDNLSAMHAGEMVDEGSRIRSKYAASPHLLRMMAVVCRTGCKLLTGCFFDRNVSYDYCLNESGDCERKSADWLPGKLCHNVR